MNFKNIFHIRNLRLQFSHKLWKISMRKNKSVLYFSFWIFFFLNVVGAHVLNNSITIDCSILLERCARAISGNMRFTDAQEIGSIENNEEKRFEENINKSVLTFVFFRWWSGFVVYRGSGEIHINCSSCSIRRWWNKIHRYILVVRFCCCCCHCCRFCCCCCLCRCCSTLFRRPNLHIYVHFTKQWWFSMSFGDDSCRVSRFVVVIFQLFTISNDHHENNNNNKIYG